MNIIFDFLNDLSQNNNRPWFNENKKRYLAAHAEFERLVQDFIGEISLFDNTIGSLEAKDCIFRIYKDTRFSKNKDPYKINMGAYICRGGGRKSPYSGYYLHLQPGGQSILSGGLYMPEPAIIARVREDFDQYYEEFKAVLQDPDFKKYYSELQGEKLKNVPRGYDKNNPAAELLKHKGIWVQHSFNDDAIESENFVAKSTEAYKQLKKFNDLINRAIEDI